MNTEQALRAAERNLYADRKNNPKSLTILQEALESYLSNNSKEDTISLLKKSVISFQDKTTIGAVFAFRFINSAYRSILKS